MKWLVGWGIVFVVSWGLGAIVCGITLWLKKYTVTKIVAFVFFALPLIILGADLLNQKRILYNFEQAKEEVARLCAKDGGDKIYKTVANVQGVFQMRARKPESYVKPDGTSYYAISDQYGMDDPYGRAQGDHEEVGEYVGFSTIFPESPPRGKQGYWFIEQMPKGGHSVGGLFRRNYLVIAKYSKDASNPIFMTQQKEVSKLKSHYGYLTEDLTTKEMRDKWIGAGRIKVIDLHTNEVLAERKGYFRAGGDLLPPGADRWTDSGAYHQNRICPSDSSIWGFLHKVLMPPKGFPTNEAVEKPCRNLAPVICIVQYPAIEMC
jgi:hypothetical protein